MALRALPVGRAGALPDPVEPLDRAAAGTSPHNLPRPRTRFIGREREIAEARRLLDATSLLTLTGTGGVGKTRLALEIAATLLDPTAGSVLALDRTKGPVPAYPDGVWLVELASLADPTLVPQAVATVIGVRGGAEHALPEALVAALHDKDLLLVLDNCEHLVEACAATADSLLRVCSRLRILATSRQPLGIDGETTFRVPPLALSPATRTGLGAATAPTPCQDREGVSDADAPSGSTRCTVPSEAARLFVERARAAVPSFTLTDFNVEAVETICHRLDGLPLAIELAAARVAVISPEQIAARLDDRFRLLTGGSRTTLPRHRTLRALVDWSHSALDEGEQLLFRRLAVFAGGWSLTAAESVCASADLESIEILDLLSGLVAKSLVVASQGDAEARYSFPETLRVYASEKLRDTGEETMLRGRHLDWLIGLAERAEPELTGARQAAWLQRLDEEHDNLRAALAWSHESGSVEGGVRLAGALYRFWATRGFVGEGRRWLADLLAQSDASPSCASAARARGRALHAAGRLAATQGDHDAARRFLAEALAISQGHDDRAGLAAGAASLGCVARANGDYAAARTLIEDALRLLRELGDAGGAADALVCLGAVANAQGDQVAARKHFEESLATHEALGNRQGMAVSLNNLGEAALEQGELATAHRLERESLILAREIGDRERASYALAALGGVAAALGESERALRLGAAAMSIRATIGKSFSAAWLARFERWLEPARRALSAEATAAAWAEGAALAEEQAITYALTPSASDDDSGEGERSGEPSAADEPVRPAARKPRASAATGHVTLREREVAGLIARGLTNRQIATELVVAEGTVANHVKSILARLGFDSRVQIAAWAIERDLHRQPVPA